VAAREAGCDEAGSWCQRGAAGCNDNKQKNKRSPLLLATTREAPGLWRRGKLDVTRREADVREGGRWLSE